MNIGDGQSDSGYPFIETGQGQQCAVQRSRRPVSVRDTPSQRQVEDSNVPYNAAEGRSVSAIPLHRDRSRTAMCRTTQQRAGKCSREYGGSQKKCQVRAGRAGAPEINRPLSVIFTCGITGRHIKDIVRKGARNAHPAEAIVSSNPR